MEALSPELGELCGYGAGFLFGVPVARAGECLHPRL